jgi:alpha-methylacyl-CoA racemase
VIELAGIGPGPFCGMLLADLGADVIRVERAGEPSPFARYHEILNRGRRSIAVDLKHPEGAGLVLALAERSDVLFEGFRPGVAERLGVGPEDCLARNPRLVYGRMTGWGRTGHYAERVGHDINYLGLTGALHSTGRPGQAPVPPLNLVGDFGGGGAFLALGIVSAVLEARRSGAGQVVDAAIVDGVSSLMSTVHALHALGEWSDERGSNLIDGGAPYYDTYRCADGRYMAVGALEDQFYGELLAGLRLSDDPDCTVARHDPARWPGIRQKLAETFATATRDQWCEVFDGRDACVTPVLTVSEALEHPHNRERNAFTTVGGLAQAAPAPRFGRTPGAVRRPTPRPGQHTREVLLELGLAPDEVQRALDVAAVRE